MVRSSTQQRHIDAPVERVCELVIGMTVFGALAGRRIMSSWLQSSLENLKAVAERALAQRA